MSLPLSNSKWVLERPLKTVERFGFDLLSGLGAGTTEEPRVLVSGFDTATEGALGSRWPVSRSVLAQAIRNISADGAKRIVVDVLLEGPGSDSTADKALHEALLGAPEVVLSCRFDVDPVSGGTKRALIPPYYNEALGVDFEQKAKLGFAEIPLDEDGVVRRIDPVRSVAGEQYPAMSVAAAGAEAWDSARFPLVFGFDSGKLVGPDIAAAAQKKFAMGTFRGKVVFLGLTGLQQTKEFNDLYSLGAFRLTTYNLGGAQVRQLPGVYIQALMTEAILQGQFRLESSPFLRVSLGAVVCGFAAWLAGCRRTRVRVIGGLGLTVALMVGWIALFSLSRLYLPVPSIGLAAILAAVWIALLDRHQLRARWGRYLSPGMLNQLQESDLDVRPVKKELTFLVVDIRGFTRASQDMDPVSTLKLINELFGAAVPVVHRHGGIIDKFLGDGFLAVFGFPEGLGGSPASAIAAAREVFAGSPEFVVACGVATGEVAVGHVTGDNRSELTFIGNAVNLASRLQTLLPEGGVLVDESTFAQAGSPSGFARGTIDVRGCLMGRPLRMSSSGEAR